MKKTGQNLKFAVLAVDVIILTVKDDRLLVRLQKVARPPHFDGIPGLPGGLISPTETAEEAVYRLISEKAHISPSKTYIEQLYTFSKVGRDPRGRVVSVAYLALIPWAQLSITEQQDTEVVWWTNASTVKNLAYDHDSMLVTAIKRLQSRITYTTVSSQIAPAEFTLTQLEKIYEVVLGKKIDKRNFRKKLLKLSVVKKSDRKLRGVRYRPADLYSFTSLKVKEISIL